MQRRRGGGLLCILAPLALEQGLEGLKEIKGLKGLKQELRGERRPHNAFWTRRFWCLLVWAAWGTRTVRRPREAARRPWMLYKRTVCPLWTLYKGRWGRGVMFKGVSRPHHAVRRVVRETCWLGDP